MKIILAAINAKYIHSCLALRSIKTYAEKQGIKPEIIEFTINQRLDYIIQQLYELKPDLLGFSCYIWNIEMVRELVTELRKVMPNTVFLLGGPEVSYDSDSFLQTCLADIIIRGEGEVAFSMLCGKLLEGKPFYDVPGIVFRKEEEIIINPSAPPPDLNKIPFPYKDLDGLENRIIYYESSRGCPYSCGYCLSSAEQGVRFLSLERVFSDLDFFLSRNVKQVKFVDRTFNCNKQHAMEIWRYLSEHDNGISNFHFEINASNMDKEQTSFLQTVRKGLFQFEIGVQTTNGQVLKEISRSNDFERITKIVRELQAGKNIHLHLDLIAGLPGEGFNSFGSSFNQVYDLMPDQLQLGFLKILRGTDMHRRQQELGLICRDKAPYEILYTPQLDFSEVLELKRIEDMVEKFYNSNHYKSCISYLCPMFPDPFAFYRSLAEFYHLKGYHSSDHSKDFGYTVLYEFMAAKGLGDAEHFQWLCKYDIYSHEKARRLPNWMINDLKPQHTQQIYDFYNSDHNIKKYLPQYSGLEGKQIARMAHLELFPFDPETNEPVQTAILFNYRCKDLLGNAQTYKVKL